MKTCVKCGGEIRDPQLADSESELCDKCAEPCDDECPDSPALPVEVHYIIEYGLEQKLSTPLLCF